MVRTPQQNHQPTKDPLQSKLRWEKAFRDIITHFTFMNVKNYSKPLSLTSASLPVSETALVWSWFCLNKILHHIRLNPKHCHDNQHPRYLFLHSLQKKIYIYIFKCAINILIIKSVFFLCTCQIFTLVTIIQNSLRIFGLHQLLIVLCLKKYNYH